MKRIASTCETFVAAPADGTMVKGQSYYTTVDGLRLMAVHGIQSEADKADRLVRRWSKDNGRTWSAPEELVPTHPHRDGTHRVGIERAYADPGSGRCLFLWTEGVLPTDHPLESNRHRVPFYAVSDDGGRSRTHAGPLICTGHKEEHPLPGVVMGKAGMSLGERGSRPLSRPDGALVVPIHAAHVGPDGTYANPGGGYTFSDCLTLLGTWQADGRLAWEASARVVGDPALSTRGFIEPTLAPLADGSLLMVMRGSNDARPDELPGHKWQVRSADGGRTWDGPRPWTYDDGSAFHSPSACSQFVPWRDGRLFWVGNLCDANPRGNNPRHPLVLGAVDPATGCLVRASVRIIDDLRPEDGGSVGLSNFYAREDRETGELLLHLTRSCPGGRWEGDALLLRMGVDGVA